MLPCYYGIAKYLGVNLIDISFKNFGILTFRWISGGFAVFLLFMSIRLLPASIAFMISNLNPLLATLFAWVILKEPQKIVNIVCAIGSFAGVIIIGVGRRNETSHGHFQIFAIWIWLLSALLGSLAIVSMRKLNQYVHYIFSPYYLWISWMVIAISFAIFDSDYFNIDKCDIIDISLVTWTGIAGLLGQLLLSLAFKYSHASSAAPLLYINWLFNVFTDTLYFKLRFFYTDIIGALVITFWVFFPVFLMWRQHYQK